MEEQPVKLYIYDITKGMARSMSGPLLGKHLDGVWHTAIVIYDQEFFFGGSGIESCAPCHTILGRPEKIEDLGNTQIPFEMFMDYLQELAATTFRPECYHLFDHNCNTFSNEVAQFLTGKPIPSYITSLPQEVLNTPLGAMLRPMIDAMQVNPGGTPIAPAVHSSNPTPSSSASATKTDTGNSKATPQDAKKSRAAVFDESDKTCLNPKAVQDLLDGAIGKEYLNILVEVAEYLATKTQDWGLSSIHINTIGLVLKDNSCTKEKKGTAASLLQQLFLLEELVVMTIHDSSRGYPGILQSVEKQPDISVQEKIIQGLCNFASHLEGRTWLLSSKDSSSNPNIEMTSSLCRYCLLHEKAPLQKLGAALTYNLTLDKINEDLALDFGCALVELLNKQLEEATARHSIIALVKCIEANQQVADLAKISGLEPGDLLKKYPSLEKIISKHLTKALDK